jgi:hypothetical protein
MGSHTSWKPFLGRHVCGVVITCHVSVQVTKYINSIKSVLLVINDTHSTLEIACFDLASLVAAFCNHRVLRKLDTPGRISLAVRYHYTGKIFCTGC